MVKETEAKRQLNRTWMKNPSDHPLFTGRDLWKLIYPLIMGYIMSLLVGMIDTSMVSYVGEDAVSGVSVVDNVMQLVIFIFMAFGTGGAVVAGQYLGRKDREKACESTEQLILFTLVISIVSMALVFALRGWILGEFFGDITPEVYDAAYTYLVITVFSLPAVAIQEVGFAAFRSMSESRFTMWVSLIMNLVNVTGNALLIYGFGMGVAGAAIPTLISRWVAAVITLVLLMNQKFDLHIRRNLSLRFHRDAVGRILRVGLPSGIENGIFQLGKILTVQLITGFGTQAIAANAVAVLLTNIVSMPAWGIQSGVMTVISRCMGAKEHDQARYYQQFLLKLAMGVLAVWAAIFCLALPLTMKLFNLSPEAVELTRHMVYVHAVGMVLLWPASFGTPAALRAAGDVRYVMVIAIMSMWVFRVGGAYVIAEWLRVGAVGVWIAMDLDWAFRTLCFGQRWKKGKWMSMKII